jgi:lysine biosynthesis protein LysW
MENLCSECGSEIEVENGALDGEIVSCPICGLDHVVKVDATGSMKLVELAIEGEDWGE